jgi:hypothetical protein
MSDQFAAAGFAFETARAAVLIRNDAGDVVAIVLDPRLVQPLRDAIGKMPNKMAAVIEAVKRETGVPVAIIIGEARSGWAVTARDLAAVVMRHVYGLSGAVIGRALNRDHSTVLAAIRRAEARLARDPSYREAALRVIRALGFDPANIMPSGRPGLV